MHQPQFGDGIISYLTRKYGGNVHENGIVTISTKSIYSDTPSEDLKLLVEFTGNGFFWSGNEPNQWICWDFHDVRITPSHYLLKASRLKSWILEGSLDGQNWTELDRRRDDDEAFWLGSTLPFAVSVVAECRFVRLTQTGENHQGDHCLFVWGMELFGTLFECRLLPDLLSFMDSGFALFESRE
jgi:hypothetical protein